MSATPAPNDDLAELVSLLGEENVRKLVNTFLQEYPQLLRQLATGDRKTCHRMAHSLKSNARVVGARALSARMAAIEQRLNDPAQPDLDPSEVAAITREFDAAAKPLRDFAGA